MISTTKLFVESEGIQLPDGSVFGAGVEHTYDIVNVDSIYFEIYQYIGKHRIKIADPMGYMDMKKWVIEQIHHYNENGFKFWSANSSDWSKATYRKQLIKDSDA